MGDSLSCLGNLLCRYNWDTVCSCSFNFNITLSNADLRQGQDNKLRDRKFALLREKTEWFRLACFMACLRILSSQYSDISLAAFLLSCGMQVSITY